MLWAALAALTVLGGTHSQEATLPAGNLVAEGQGDCSPSPEVRSVVLRDRGDGAVVSSPCVAGDHVYVAVAHRKGFDTFGAVYCLDRASLKVLWIFDDDGAMKQVFSSPCVAEGRLFIGEGFHDDSNCRLYCLDAATGHKRWAFQIGSQTESSPCVAGGKVFFGAGNDGVYALDVATGKKCWQYASDGGRLLRICAGPAVVGNRLYVGSGVDRNRADDPGETAAFCLNADTGRLVWKQRTDLPCWGTPAVGEDAVYFGLGNGDVFNDAPAAAGALLCLDAASGQVRWRYDVPNGVLSRPALDRQRIYFGCRDSCCYALGRHSGKLHWKQTMDSPVVAAPALDLVSSSDRAATVVAVGIAGKVCCLDALSGKIHWTYEALHGPGAHLCSSPTVVVRPTAEGERRHVYFGVGLNHLRTPALFCLTDFLPEWFR
jgi:outer membrane protein assembly factor BamB